MTAPTPTLPFTLPAGALVRNDAPDALVPHNEAIGRLALAPSLTRSSATSRSSTTSTWRRRRASSQARA